MVQGPADNTSCKNNDVIQELLSPPWASLSPVGIHFSLSLAVEQIDPPCVPWVSLVKAAMSVTQAAASSQSSDSHSYISGEAKGNGLQGAISGEG